MKKTRTLVPTVDVLEWLKQNHPELHAVAELDRTWVWLPVDLRGDHNEATRDSISLFGFRYAKRGHPLPSGANGTWSHCGQQPIPFKRRGKGGKGGGYHNSPKPKDERRAAIHAEIEALLAGS